MKKILTFMSTLLLSFTLLAGCSNNLNPTNYLINSDGNLIVIYEDGTTEDLGEWGDEIINSLADVTISEDGYYIINGIKTNIKAVEPVSYELDADGNLIVTYSDGSTENLGPLGSTLVNGVETISISEDGYYVINGVETDIVAKASYVVSFDSGFNYNVPDQKVLEGNKVIRPEIDRTGYTLDGWYCNGEEWRFNSDIVSNDMNLAASWTAKSYTINFDEDGGDEVDNLTVTYDENYVLPLPTKNLYSFAGWSFNNQNINTSGKWQIDGDDTITLKANWTRITHNVIFDSNGGDSVNNLVVNSYTQIESLPIPEWTDHRFIGWLLNDEFVELPLQMKDSDINLVASWKSVTDEFEFRDETDNTITITKYIGNDSTVTIPETISNKTVKTLAENAFAECYNVKNIVLPSSLVNLEFKSLYGCSGLESLTISGNAVGSLKYFFGNDESNIPLSLEVITFAEGSTTYSKDLFNELPATHLFKVNLPACLKTTPPDAFYNCINIKEAYLPEGINTISSRTFCNCTNLVKVNIPSTVTAIGMNCFINLPNLPYLIVPNSVESFDYASLAATESLILFERTDKLSSSSVFSIYEDQMDIYYGFEEIKNNDTFTYALCKVGSVKQAIIISLVDGATMPGTIPDSLDGYPVVLNRIK